MSGILTVPGSQMDINTPSSAVKLDAGALNVRSRGTLAIAGAVEGLGEEAQQLSNDLSKVKMTTIAADADFRMRAAQHAFVKSTQGDPNDSDWTERAQQMSQQVKDDIYATHKVPPAMRPQLETSLRGWGQTLQIQAQTMSAVQSIKRAELAVETSFQEAGRDGSAEGMINAVQMGKASKLDPVKMEALEKSIPKTLALTSIENGLRENPAKTLEMLNSGASLPMVDQHGVAIDPSKVFPPKELESLRVQAQRQTSIWQASNLQNMEVQDADPISGRVPDETVDAKVESKEINPIAGRNFKARQDRDLRTASAQQGGVLRAEAGSQMDWGITYDESDKRRTELLAKSEEIKDPKQKQESINAINRNYSRAVVEQDKKEHDILMADMRDREMWGVDLDTAWSGFITRAQNIGDQAKRKEIINYANQQKAAILKKGETAEKPVEKEIYAQMKADRAAAMFVPITQENMLGKTHWFSANEPAKFSAERIKGGLQALTDPKGAAGTKNPEYLSDDDIKKKFGENMTRDKLIAEERSFAANLEQKMALFFKGKPDATYKEANVFRMEMEKPYVMEQAKEAINTPVSGKSSARPPNAAFYSKSTGKWYDKDKKVIP